MAKGLKIAKEGHKVEDSSEFIYVDSATPMLKVYKYLSGAMISDGVNRQMTWTGDVQGKTVDGGTSLQFQLNVKHDLGYAPMYMLFAEFYSNGGRSYVTNYGVGVGDVEWFGWGDADGIYLSGMPYRYDAPHNSMSFNLPPLAGNYHWFMYIFYNKVTPPNTQAKILTPGKNPYF